MIELKVAKAIIIDKLYQIATHESFRDIFEINNGNNEILLEHINALINIFTKAKEELEKENK